MVKPVEHVNVFVVCELRRLNRFHCVTLLGYILRNDKVATLDVLKQGAAEHRSQRDQKNKNVAEQYVIP